MRKRNWSRKKQATFFIQLNRLLLNGFDLMTALKMMQMQQESWRKDLTVILAALQKGTSFRHSLGTFISQQIVEEMGFVELHGQLLAYLNLLGRRERKRQQYVKKFWQLAFYPLFLLCLIVLLSIYFIKQFSHVSLLGANWLGVVGGLGVMVAVILSLFKSDRWLLVLGRLPIIRQCWRMNLQSQLCFQMGWLLKAGVNLADILLVLDQQPQLKSLQHYRMLNYAVEQALHEGAPLGDVLKFMPLLPKDVQVLFEMGQTELQLGNALLVLAQELQRDVERKILMYLQLVQPILFILIGLCIIALYQKYLLPSYQMIGGLPQL